MCIRDRIKSLKRVADAAWAESCFLLIDEILKGTNTVERLAASQAVLEELHRRDCFCIAATHDEELPQRLSPQYENYHLQETLSPEGITFDYKLYPGPSNSRNAIALLSLTGFSRSVVARADVYKRQNLGRPSSPSVTWVFPSLVEMESVTVPNASSEITDSPFST